MKEIDDMDIDEVLSTLGKCVEHLVELPTPLTTRELRAGIRASAGDACYEEFVAQLCDDGAEDEEG